jgi:DNA-binding transcriptional MerR regulator
VVILLAHPDQFILLRRLFLLNIELGFNMSITKEYLMTRKSDLESKLKPMEAMKEELKEVLKALKTLEDPRPSCRGCSSGCDICRTGPMYR